MSEMTTKDDGLGDLTVVDGPWDASQAPAGTEFIDFGPLKLPLIAGLKARVEFDQRTKRVGAVSVKVNNSEVQLQVIAAPRGQQYWLDVRRTMLERLRKGAGNQHAMEGHFGTEVIATLTGRRRDGVLADAPMRLVGVEGDRWVLRAVVTGLDVTTDETVDRVNALISHCAVDRGEEPIGAGTVLELMPPPGSYVPDEESA